MNNLLGSLILMAAMSSPVIANMPEGNSDIGMQKAYTCQFCHGVTGVSPRDDYPNMNGQNAEYLYDAMMAYKEGQRDGAMGRLMKQQMSVLSAQDMADIAAYYAEQSR